MTGGELITIYTRGIESTDYEDGSFDFEYVWVPFFTGTEEEVNEVIEFLNPPLSEQELEQVNESAAKFFAYFKQGESK